MKYRNVLGKKKENGLSIETPFRFTVWTVRDGVTSIFWEGYIGVPDLEAIETLHGVVRSWLRSYDRMISDVVVTTRCGICDEKIELEHEYDAGWARHHFICFDEGKGVFCDTGFVNDSTLDVTMYRSDVKMTEQTGRHMRVVPKDGVDMLMCIIALNNMENPVDRGWEDGFGHTVCWENGEELGSRNEDENEEA